MLQCGRRQALDVFFREILRETNLGIVGCACSPATLAIADAVDYWNIPQVCYDRKVVVKQGLSYPPPPPQEKMLNIPSLLPLSALKE